MLGGDMLIGGDVKRIPLSLMSKGEKIEELFPSMPKGEKIEESFHQFLRVRMLSMVSIDVKGVH